jgi:hypothetical protein
MVTTWVPTCSSFERFAGGEVDPHLLDAQVLAHLLAAGVQPGEGDVRRAVFVPRQVGVDAPDAADGDAVAPLAGRVRCGEDNAPARGHRDGDDDVEDAVAVADGRRPDATAGGQRAARAGSLRCRCASR